MRKRLKIKKRSCALCKPHKMGWDTRWSAKEEAGLKEFESAKESLPDYSDRYKKDDYQ